MERRTL
ncbi:hypothetical protein TCSYLVIO_001218, partial [Trypanosoma cruzi]